jgi:predicted DNA-binding transcriptional regulator AlpA
MSKVVTLPLPSNSITGDQILRLPRVKELTGMSRSFIYSDKDFPRLSRSGCVLLVGSEVRF